MATGPSRERELAVKLLVTILGKGGYSNLELDESLEGMPSSGFITELVYGTIRRLKTLDWIISRLSNRPIEKVRFNVLNILRCSLYQLLFMDSIPDAVAVNEGVLLARKESKHSGVDGFINAVLRSATRSRDKIKPEGVSASLLAGSLHVKAARCLLGLGFQLNDSREQMLPLIESHPDWMVDSWIEQFGPEEAAALCAANNRPSKVCLRTNLLKVGRSELIAKLSDEGVYSFPGELVPESILCSSFQTIARSPLFRDGLFQVQDEGAMLIGRLLGPLPGERILDMCSAPGGKTTHICELMGDRGEVVAVDVHPHRLALVKEAATRLGHHTIRCLEADARTLDVRETGVFDRILLDAPCSGTGVVGRRPEIRWRRGPEDVEELSRIQREILGKAVTLLKPNGTLVYSTCSLQSAEDGENIERFLKAHPYVSLDGNPIWTFPHKHGTDGFYMARLRRNA